MQQIPDQFREDLHQAFQNKQDDEVNDNEDSQINQTLNT